MMSIILSLKMASKGKPVLRGHDHFWSVIMERHRAGQTFSVRDIDLASNTAIETVRDYVRRLEKARLIEAVEASPTFVDTRYQPQVIQSASPRVRRDGTVIESQPATQCMWNMMRGPVGRNGFTYLDIVRCSQTDETSITTATARSYIQMLAAAGYLIVITAAKPRTPGLWKLDPKMNTGPQAPMILRTKVVFDPNRQEVFGSSEAEEVMA